jgi:ABC-2 type transport system permease protein
VAVNSISTEVGAACAACRTMFRERFYVYGRAYALDWMVRPIFDIAIIALIYVGGSDDLVSYVVVALAFNMFLFSTIYYVGEILDRERVRGTLPSLFLTPAARSSWMAGYAAAGLIETLGRVLIILLAGMLFFDVRLDPNLPALLVVFPLYLLSLSGLGLVLSGIGLLIKRSNSLSNLISPLFLLVGGAYVPVDNLPGWLQVIARMLPMGYAMDALTAITNERATLADVWSSTAPLSIFAVVSPIAGLLAFRWLDVMVRRRGEIDLY